MKDPQKKKPPREETPFQKFERLTKKVVSVPKQMTEKNKKGKD